MPIYINLFGLDFPIYSLFWFLGFPCCITFNAVYYRKKYRMGNLKNVFLTMLSINGAYGIIMILSWYLQRLSLHGINYVRIVGFFPLIYFITAKLSKSSFSNTLDFLTPATSIGNMVVHIGCIFPGCCHGYNISKYPTWLQWMGIYSNETGTYTFPIQLVECFFYGLIAVIIVIWARKKDFHTEGKSYPIYLVLFGVIRFCLEFLRDNEKIAGPLSEFSFWCIGWVVEGVTWLIVINLIKRKKLNSAITKKNSESSNVDSTNPADATPKQLNKETKGVIPWII